MFFRDGRMFLPLELHDILKDLIYFLFVLYVIRLCVFNL